MFADQLAEVIGRAHGIALDDVTRALWAAVSAAQINDDEALHLSEAINARRMLDKVAQSPATGFQRNQATFPAREPQRCPERSVAIERRRRLAASGPMPPALASRFTTGELAVMRIVADEVTARGSCSICLDAIAARAGVSRSLAKGAIRQAKSLGMIEVRERRRPGAKSLTNIITIVDREWPTWLKQPPRIGGRNFAPTKNRDFKTQGRRPAAPSKGATEREGRARDGLATDSGAGPKRRAGAVL